MAITQESRWVAAAPFRAHVRFVSAVSGLPWSAIALEAGVPLTVVHHLLDMRPGRQVHRLRADLAEQLLAVTVESVEQLARAFVPAGTARDHAARLTRFGWTAETLAARLHITVGELRSVARGETGHVSRLLELRMASLAASTAYTEELRRSSAPRAA